MTVTDPTFYRSAAEAIAAPREGLAYVVAFDRAGERPDALTVVDVDEGSSTYGQVVGWADRAAATSTSTTRSPTPARRA